jgi:hypothetical protein
MIPILVQLRKEKGELTYVHTTLAKGFCLIPDRKKFEDRLRKYFKKNIIDIGWELNKDNVIMIERQWSISNEYLKANPREEERFNLYAFCSMKQLLTIVRVLNKDKQIILYKQFYSKPVKDSRFTI